MATNPRLYYFDTVTLSNFALAGRVDLLAERYGDRARITSEVLSEVLDGIVAGYHPLRAVAEALEEGKLGNAGMLNAEERGIFLELLPMLSTGEASCIAMAQVRGGIVVTDDRAARGCCGEREILFTGTIGILKALVRDGNLTLEVADLVLQTMIDAGYYSPVRRISELGR